MIHVGSLRPFGFSIYEIKMLDSLSILNDQWHLLTKDIIKWQVNQKEKDKCHILMHIYRI